MGDLLRKAVDDRRKILIEKLITFRVYKKDDKQLFELSLTELENEYKAFRSYCHPHNDLYSIRWSSIKP